MSLDSTIAGLTRITLEMAGRIQFVPHDYVPPAETVSGTSRDRRRQRRTHTKSRNGCEPCRKRRIKVWDTKDYRCDADLGSKCDEGKPSCQQCIYRRVKCSFGVRENQVSRQTQQYEIHSLNTAATDFEDLVDFQGGWTKATSTNIYLALFSKFPAVINSLCSPLGADPMLEVCPRLIPHHPFYFHALIALANAYAHHGCLRKEDKQWSQMCRYHAQLAMQQYNTALSFAKDDVRVIDALLGTALVINAMLYIWEDDLHLTERWLSLDTQGDAANKRWYASLSGPALILERFWSQMMSSESYWSQFLITSLKIREDLFATDVMDDGFLQDLYNACHDSCQLLNLNPEIYNEPLRVIRVFANRNVLDTTDGQSQSTGLLDVILLMSLPSTIHEDFNFLLRNDDALALIIVGVWLALLTRLERCKWWCYARAMVEGKDVCARLHMLSNQATGFVQDASMFLDSIFEFGLYQSEQTHREATMGIEQDLTSQDQSETYEDHYEASML